MFSFSKLSEYASIAAEKAAAIGSNVVANVKVRSVARDIDWYSATVLVFYSPQLVADTTVAQFQTEEEKMAQRKAELESLRKQGSRLSLEVCA